jgi:hypothetical protein
VAPRAQAMQRVTEAFGVKLLLLESMIQDADKDHEKTSGTHAQAGSGGGDGLDGLGRGVAVPG